MSFGTHLAGCDETGPRRGLQQRQCHVTVTRSRSRTRTAPAHRHATSRHVHPGLDRSGDWQCAPAPRGVVTVAQVCQQFALNRETDQLQICRTMSTDSSLNTATMSNLNPFGNKSTHKAVVKAGAGEGGHNIRDDVRTPFIVPIDSHLL